MSSSSNPSSIRHMPAPGGPGYQTSEPVFQTFHFTKVGSKKEILEKHILYVYTAAHQKLRIGGNHWCFYLVTGSRSSVCIDLTPSMCAGTHLPMGTKAQLFICEWQSATLYHAEHKCRLSVRKGVTVEHFINAIVDNGRDKYELDVCRRQSRFWIAHQLDLFRDLRLFTDQSEVNEAHDCLVEEYDDKKPTDWLVGTPHGFYYD